MQRRRRNVQLELGVVYLLYEIMQAGVHTFPPVTLFTVAFQVALYVGFINVPWKKNEVCISSVSILKQKEWKRFIFSTVEHANDMHLYYNMTSFLLKGKSLEKKFGSFNFFLLLSIIAALTNALYIAIGQTMTEITGITYYQNSCAIGFSGVIFALKVLTTAEYPKEMHRVFGITMPGKYASWVELVIIHLLQPNASFMGHFAGILAGVIYCKTYVGSIIDLFIYKISGFPVLHGIVSYEDYN